MKILLIMMATLFPVNGNIAIDLACTKPVGLDYATMPINLPKKGGKK